MSPHEVTNKAFPEGPKGRYRRLGHDSGGEFTSYRLREFMKCLEIEDILIVCRIAGDQLRQMEAQAPTSV